MNKFFNVFLLAHLCLGVPLPSADPVADADAIPAAYASDYGYYLPAASPSTQFHAQDELGQYNYGYQSADQTKTEVKSADGVVRGSYSYVDSNGIVQTTNYISDALGFRVAATNLPVHQTEAVAEAAVAPVVAVNAAPAVEAAPVAVAAAAPVAASAQHHVMTPSVSYAYLPYASNYAYHVLPTQYVNAVSAPAVQTQQVVAAAPAVNAVPVVNAAPVVEAAPAAAAAAVPVVAVAGAGPTASQYHAQDELGQYSFGYNDANSVRQETKTADGVVSGAYRYVDSEGRIQTVQYVADSLGFRVAGSNLPVFSAAAPVDTPEVAAAKAEHAQAYSVVQAAALEAVQAEPVAVAQVYEAVEESPVEYYGAAKAVATPVAVAPVVSAPVATAPVVAAEPYYGAAQVYNQPEVPVVQSTYAATPIASPVDVAPVAVAAAPVAVAPAVTPVAVAPAPAASQYHSQDELGQYAFGYSDSNSVKQEVKTADGIVRGSYSYVDADGIVQSVNYIADALGFRVGATNLPVHVVDEANAAAAAPVEVAYDAKPAVAAAPVISPLISYSYLPYATNYAYNLPVSQASPVVENVETPEVVVKAAPVANTVPVVATAPVPNDVSSQYHAQDEVGQYNYGYSSATQTKAELKTADGITRGSYSYLDANGLIQTVNYISDAMGFRVAATNLPVHHVDGETVDTPVVEAAYKASVLTPSVNYAYLPYAQNYAYSAPAAA